MIKAPPIRKPEPAAARTAKIFHAPPRRPNAQLVHAVIQRKEDERTRKPGGCRCESCVGKAKNWLQRKLAIGSAHDPLEREADRVADQVLAGPARGIGRAPLKIQRAAPGSGDGASHAPVNVHKVIASPGRALDSGVRHDMEQRFGRDFSQVRVHQDAAADRSARDVGARAYTVGRDIVFAAGQFEPSTGAGRRLLAHELTHVVQQSGADRRERGRGAASASASGAEVLQRTPAAPTNAAGPAVRDISRIRIDAVADFLASGLTAARTVNVHLNDATIVHLSWELYNPNDVLMEGSFSTLPGNPGSTTTPFTLRPSQFSGAGFIAGRYILRCVGRAANHQPVAYADRDFNVLTADLTTGTALATTYGSLTYTSYTKTDANRPARPRFSVDVTIAFQPLATVTCPQVGWIQNVQVLNPDGTSLQARVNAEQDARKTPLVWSIDRLAGGPTPFYGTEGTAGGAINIPAGKGSFGSGGAAPTPASLIDRPSAAIAMTFHFEACAICRSGPSAGQVYGCTTWGYSADAAGKVTLSPRGFRQMPSDQFEEARAAWNTWRSGLPAASQPEAAPALRSP